MMERIGLTARCYSYAYVDLDKGKLIERVMRFCKGEKKNEQNSGCDVE